MKRLGTCTCVALYDLDIIHSKLHMKELFYYLERWFNDHDWSPTRMSLRGNNIPYSTQTRTFKHYKKLIEKLEFKNIEYVWIGSPLPNHDQDYFDSLLSSSIDLSSTEPVFTLYFHNDVIPHDWKYVEILIKDLSQWIKSGYGVAYQRDFDKGPGMYPYGVIVGLRNKYGISKDPEIEKEQDHMTKWLHTYGDPKRYHHGDLRDIYPLNFLSKEHLERSVNDKTLKSWIESSADHGTLSPLTDELWSWHVPEDKISSVREALRPTGFVLCI